MWLPLMYHHPRGTWLASQACVLTGNRTGDPLVCRMALNPLNHTSQGSPYYSPFICCCSQNWLIIDVKKHSKASCFSIWLRSWARCFPPGLFFFLGAVEIKMIVNACTLSSYGRKSSMKLGTHILLIYTISDTH